MAAARRILIVGLDGGTWTIFEPLVRAGHMPHLAALMARGTYGVLTSTVPPLTLPAWSSFMTGRSPGGHGIYAFRRLDPTSYDFGGLANGTDLRTLTLWDRLGRLGHRVGVINVPPSYPLRPVEGYIVGCMLTPPGEPLTCPAEIEADLGPYQVDLKAPRRLRDDPATFVTRATEYLEALRVQTAHRGDAVVRLMARHPTDVTCVVFYAPDRMQHNFWDEIHGRTTCSDHDAQVPPAVTAVWRVLDDALGALVEAAEPETTIILASDHGFVPKPAHAVHVNRWLADRGFLHERRAWRVRRRIVRRLVPAAWRPRFDTVEFLQLDRGRTRAWATTLDYGVVGIWVHATERYPLGCVPVSDYDGIRQQIIDGLRTLRGPDGGPVFASVARREDIYQGRFVADAPDVVAVCAPSYGVVNESLRRDLRTSALFGPFHEAGFTGTHDLAGVYLFAGPTIAAQGRGPTYPIESIVPTVLHFLGHEVPRTLDGPVCEAVLRADVRAAHPVRLCDDADDDPTATPGWRSAEDEAQVADHLRALGYLE